MSDRDFCRSCDGEGYDKDEYDLSGEKVRCIVCHGDGMVFREDDDEMPNSPEWRNYAEECEDYKNL